MKAPIIYPVERLLDIGDHMMWTDDGYMGSTHMVEKNDLGMKWNRHKRPTGDRRRGEDGKLRHATLWESISNRMQAAWLVFTGRADAVVWPKGQ